MKKILAVMLCVVFAAVLTACSDNNNPGNTGEIKPVSDNSVELSADIQANPVDSDPVMLKGDPAAASADFAVRLFKAGARSGKNTLISPISVLYALSMTANGAGGETLSQMENVLGESVAELNSYLHAYIDSISESDRCKLNIANAIWFTDSQRFTVDKNFLQTNADYYGAGIYQAPFDASTLEDINNWIENKTDGMIKHMLDDISSDAVMYLVNALAFDAEWQEIYYDYQILPGTFTKEDGVSQDIELMYSEEYKYLEDEHAKGFIKHYADTKYAFAALLPNEGVTVDEYLADMTGEKLHSMLSAPQNCTVSAAIPKFESEYSTEMSEILTDMGMPDAFDGEKADFSGLGTSTGGNIFINRVLHKTFIAVDERGTKAGAATVVEMTDGCAAVYEEPKVVILDRPFVYMLIDCEAGIPLFIGTMMDMK